MNNPNPLPPLSPFSPPRKRLSSIGVVVATIVVLHAVFFGGLLFQGCQPKTTESPLGSSATNVSTDLQPLTNRPYPDWTNGATTTTTQQVADTTAVPAPTPTNWVPPVQPPIQPQPVVSQPAAAATEYEVVKGDILARIAAKHGIALKELIKANPTVNPLRLKIGQKLVIPPAAPAPAPVASSTGQPAPEGGVIHVVKRGENLTRISRQYGVSIKAIRAANNLKTDRINEGQKLTVPAQSTTGGVVPGATASLAPAPAPADSGTTVSGIR